MKWFAVALATSAHSYEEDSQSVLQKNYPPQTLDEDASTLNSVSELEKDGPATLDDQPSTQQSAFLQSKILELQEMSKKTLTEQSALPADIIALLKEMRETVVGDAMKAIETMHRADHKAVHEESKAIDTCLSTYEEASDGCDVASWQARMRMDLEAFTTCAKDVELKNKMKTMACQARDDFAQKFEKPASFSYTAPAVPKVDSIGECVSTPRPDAFAAWLEDWDKWVSEKYASWKKLDSSCFEATRAFEAAQPKCDYKAKDMKSDFCTWRTGCYEHCALQGECYESSTESFSKTLKSALSNAKARQMDFSAVKKIDCYLDVMLLPPGAENRTEDAQAACIKKAGEHPRHLEIHDPFPSGIPDAHDCTLTVNPLVPLPGVEDTCVLMPDRCDPLPKELRSLDSRETVAVVVTSDGTESKPHCTWSGTCSWTPKEQAVCAEVLCQKSGFETGSYVSTSNNPCTGTYEPGKAYFVVMNTGKIMHGGAGWKDSQVTATCFDKPPAVSELVISAGTEAKPHCSWASKCAWTSTEQAKCTDLMCRASGFDTGVFISATNDPCKESYVTGTYHFAVMDQDRVVRGGHNKDAGITATCFDHAVATPETITVTSDGTAAKPHCSWNSKCGWTATEQALCSDMMCKAAGYETGTFISASNDPCKKSFVSGRAYFVIMDRKEVIAGSHSLDAQITAACSATKPVDEPGTVTTVTSDGTESKPYCSWAGKCGWTAKEQGICAVRMCQSSGFRTGKFVSASNNPCTTSFVSGKFFMVMMDSTFVEGKAKVLHVDYHKDARITADCYDELPEH